MTAVSALGIALETIRDLAAASTILQARFAKSEAQLKTDSIFFGEISLPKDAPPGAQLPESYILLFDCQHKFERYGVGAAVCLTGGGGVEMFIRDYPRFTDNASDNQLDFTDFVASFIEDIVKNFSPVGTVKFTSVVMVHAPTRVDPDNRASEDYQGAAYQFIF